MNRIFLALLPLVIAAVVLAGARPAKTDSARAAASGKVPVVVELFTSEGCSSCPSADALLLEMERTQPLPGVEVVALSEHVDYWNRLGWKDPFSAPAFTERQRDYAANFSSGSYTPQAVVSGQYELVGSRREQLVAAVAKAARAPQAAVRVSAAAAATAGELPVHVQVENVPAAADEKAEVLLAVTEKGLSSNVGWGENAGRLLPHPAVVRELRPLGTVGTNGTFAATVPVRLNKQWKAENVQVVVFVQQQRTRRIVGAGTLPRPI